MDIQMPVMDGITATKEIRSLGRDIPIIAMTANVMPQQIRAYKEAGVDDHIGKPMKRSDLLKKVREWIPTERLAEDAAGTSEPASNRKEAMMLRSGDRRRCSDKSRS